MVRGQVLKLCHLSRIFLPCIPQLCLDSRLAQRFVLECTGFHNPAPEPQLTLGTIGSLPNMANIQPFRALRYDPSRVALADVATQPYDKITPEMQERYYSASPHNLVRIILGKRQATDGPADNPYTRAAGFLSDWRRQGVLQQDAEPSIYR